jgi:pilus assembly protein FimV
LVEAEIYVSYGRFEQAVAILKNALIKNPNKHDVSLALLRILFDRKERGAFDTYASKVYEAHKNGSLANPVMWETIASMGIQLDAGNPIYQSVAKETKAAAPDISIAPAETQAHSNVMEFVLDDVIKPSVADSPEKLGEAEELFPKKSN